MVKEYEIRDPRITEQTTFQTVSSQLSLPCFQSQPSEYARVGQDETDVQAAPSAYVAISLACIAGLLCGYDIGCTSAVMAKVNGERDGTTVTGWFGLSVHEQSLGMTASLMGGLLASVLLTALADCLGPQTELKLAALLHTSGSLLSGIPWPHFWIVLAGRFIFGFGSAFALHAAPEFIAAVAPAATRQRWVGVLQASMVGGITCGLLAALIFQQLVTWRCCFGLPAVPGSVLLIGLCCVAPSPAWLRIQAHQHPGMYTRDLAIAALASYRVGETEQVEMEMLQIEASLSASCANLSIHHTASETLVELVKQRAVLGGSCVLLVLQSLTGQTTVLYYAVTIFSDAGFGKDATMAAAALSVAKLVVALIAAFSLHKIGRRRRLCVGVLTMVVALVGLGLVFLSAPIVTPPLQEPRRVFSASSSAAVMLCLLALVVGYQAGFRHETWMVVRDLGFPLHARSVAMGAALVVSYATNLAMTYSYLGLQRLITTQGLFFLYSFMSLLSLGFVYFGVSDTVGSTVEQVGTNLATPEPKSLHAISIISPPPTEIQTQSLCNTISTRKASSDSLTRRSPATSPDLSPTNGDRAPSPKSLVPNDAELGDQL